jgi:hypothetical protein
MVVKSIKHNSIMARKLDCRFEASPSGSSFDNFGWHENTALEEGWHIQITFLPANPGAHDFERLDLPPPEEKEPKG